MDPPASAGVREELQDQHSQSMSSAESWRGVGPVQLGEVVQTFHDRKGGEAGRSVVLVNDVDPPPASIHPGDRVEIRWPDGRILQTRPQGISLAGGCRQSTIGIHLPAERDSLEVPVGAWVWKPS